MPNNQSFKGWHSHSASLMPWTISFTSLSFRGHSVKSYLWFMLDHKVEACLFRSPHLIKPLNLYSALVMMLSLESSDIPGPNSLFPRSRVCFVLFLNSLPSLKPIVNSCDVFFSSNSGIHHPFVFLWCKFPPRQHFSPCN